jgi:hypothetical protein
MNVLNMDFNTDGVQAHVTNIPFSSHKSFTTESEAWQYFMSYYPCITSPADATFMNENCPVEASNLNNSSRLLQEVSGLCSTVPPNTLQILQF